jgi:hypothetical protein
VNAVRGLTKSCDYRMPASSTRCFAKRSLAVMPPGLAQALGPVLEQIAAMTMKIKQYDRQIQELGQAEALTFVLTVGSKEHFKQCHNVGCYLVSDPGAVSLAIAILNSASPRQAMYTSGRCTCSCPSSLVPAQHVEGSIHLATSLFRASAGDRKVTDRRLHIRMPQPLHQG